MNYTLEQEFAAPSNAYRGKPFWCWNGRLERTELLRQIDVLAEMGMGGFFMHSRVGLATEYLGQEWFELTRACAERARELGMEAWLYDEDRWPSGAAGGLLTRESAQYRMRYLRCQVREALPTAEERAAPGAVALFVAEADGETLRLGSYQRLALETPGELALAPGQKVLFFAWETVRPHGFFNNGTYLDTLNPEAVEQFLRLTHDRYAAECGEYFGNPIPGIFTDEPHHGLVMSVAIPNWTYPPESHWLTPWTESFPTFFTQKFGWDLRERLPELYLQAGGEPLSPVKWQYMEALHSRFLESFAAPCRERCEQLGLRLTGHILGEETPGTLSITNGSALRYYEQMETPGIDQLARENRAHWIARQVSSAARQQGKRWVISELYGCTGWQTSFADHKEIGDWQALYGINIRCHHLAWYSMAGESKRDFPGSIFYQSGWWREYGYVEAYFARLGLLLQQGRAVCEVLVLHPLESQWAQIHPGWGGWLRSLAERSKKIDREFEETFRWLTAAQVEFDYGDEEQLARLGGIEGQLLRLGEGRYSAVLVTGLETMRASTLERLEEFRAAGGQVIFAGNAPSYVEAAPSPSAAELAARCTQVPRERETLVAALQAAAPPLVRLGEIGEQADDKPVLLHVRRLEGGDLLVAVCNTDPDRARPDLWIECAETGFAQVQEWDCRSGARYAGEAEPRRWRCPLPPLGERVFRLVQTADPALKPRPVLEGAESEVPGPFVYTLDEPNALVLDQFEWRLGADAEWQARTDILAIDQQVRNSLGLEQRSLGMVQPWARTPALMPPAAAAALTLRGQFHCAGAQPHTLLMEQPDRWQVRINGRALDTTLEGEWFIDPCFRQVAIPADLLREGENELELHTEFQEETDLEAVYLLGEFGVYGVAEGTPRLAPLPERLAVGNVCAQGLPFYTGRISYELPVEPGAVVRGLRLPQFGGALAMVGGEFIAFPPYEAALAVPAGETLRCEVILTRRNLFGPLHWNVASRNFVAPGSFRTVGEEYATIPQLEPSGLLAAPVLLLGPPALRD